MDLEFDHGADVIDVPKSSNYKPADEDSYHQSDPSLENQYSAKRKPPLPPRGKNGFGRGRGGPRSSSSAPPSDRTISHQERNAFYTDKIFHVFLFGHFYNDYQDKAWDTTFYSLFYCLDNRYQNIVFYFLSDGKTRTVPDAFLAYLQERSNRKFSFDVKTIDMTDHDRQNLGSISPKEEDTICNFSKMKGNPMDICIAISFLLENSQISAGISESLRDICYNNMVKFVEKPPGEKFGYHPDFNCITRTPFYLHDTPIKPRQSNDYNEYQEPPASRKRGPDQRPDHMSYQRSPEGGYYSPPRHDESHQKPPSFDQSDIKDDADLLTAQQILRLQNPERRKRLCVIRGLPGETLTDSEMFYHPNGQLAEIRVTTRILYP